MAVMARELGIPARVAVGFLQPERDGDSWVYSAHDLHAWPELFFPGSGWVRFEPTPPTRANGVPGYTTQAIDIPDDSELTATATDQESAGNPAPGVRPPGRRGRGRRRRGRRRLERRLPVAAGPDRRRRPARWSWSPRSARAPCAAGAATSAACSAPRRPGRSSATPRSTSSSPWPSHRSPWQTRQALVQLFGAATSDEFSPERPRRGPDTNPDAVFALDRIVHALERLRYARPDESEHGTYRAEMQACVEALYGGTTQRARRAADWWPSSVFRRPHPDPRDEPGHPHRSRPARPRGRPRRLTQTDREIGRGSGAAAAEPDHRPTREGRSGRRATCAPAPVRLRGRAAPRRPGSTDGG